MPVTDAGIGWPTAASVLVSRQAEITRGPTATTIRSAAPSAGGADTAAPWQERTDARTVAEPLGRQWASAQRMPVQIHSRPSHPLASAGTSSGESTFFL